MPKRSVWASPPQLTAYTASPRPRTWTRIFLCWKKDLFCIERRLWGLWVSSLSSWPTSPRRRKTVPRSETSWQGLNMVPPSLHFCKDTFFFWQNLNQPDVNEKDKLCRKSDSSYCAIQLGSQPQHLLWMWQCQRCRLWLTELWFWLLAAIDCPVGCRLVTAAPTKSTVSCSLVGFSGRNPPQKTSLARLPYPHISTTRRSYYGRAGGQGCPV